MKSAIEVSFPKRSHAPKHRSARSEGREGFTIETVSGQLGTIKEQTKNEAGRLVHDSGLNAQPQTPRG